MLNKPWLAEHRCVRSAKWNGFEKVTVRRRTDRNKDTFVKYAGNRHTTNRRYTLDTVRLIQAQQLTTPLKLKIQVPTHKSFG